MTTTCLLCQHYCKLKPQQIGICGVNQNINNKIKCLVYGYPNAINIDPIEKKPLYHFLQNTKTFSIGTIGCNFKCSFCQNWKLSQTKDINKSQYYSPQDIVDLALQNNCQSISYTYNEPTIFFPYIKDIATLAHKNGLKNIMVTNGFESNEVASQMLSLIDAINVDLKSFNDKYYKFLLGGKLDKILSNLKFFVQNDIHIEITTLIVPSHNNSNEELHQIASFIAKELNTNIPWHISAFRPEYKELELPRTSIQTLLQAQQIGYSYGLKHIYIGNLTKEITKRKLAVNGQFYPDKKEEIKEYINYFNNILDKNDIKNNINFTPKAIITPHAGYIYSGFTANIAYKYIPKNIQTIVVIGSSHKVAFDGASISQYDSYPTPLGNLTIDTKLVKTLIKKYDFITFQNNIHQEHSTETQMPFIKYYLPNVQVVEIIYGKIDFFKISKIIDEILKDKNNFIIISTDLSHFYNIDDAKKLDNICLEGISQQNIKILNQGCEACGITGVKALIKYAQDLKMKSKLCDYRTSADASKDNTRVVGYASFVFGV